MVVKRLIQGPNNVARVRVEPRSCDQGGRKNDALTLSTTQPPTNQSEIIAVELIAYEDKIEVWNKPTWFLLALSVGDELEAVIWERIRSFMEDGVAFTPPYDPLLVFRLCLIIGRSC